MGFIIQSTDTTKYNSPEYFQIMIAEEARLKEARFSRIRRLKRLLRPLPRKATLHKYPILSMFTVAARKRAYLWSFRSSEAVPALYAGCILAFMPLYGMQIPLAFCAAIIFRANLPILAGIQLISNPITLPFIYWIAYLTGDFFLSIFGGTPPTIEISSQIEESNLLLKSIRNMSAMVGGGMIIGYFAGFISSIVYRIMAKRAAQTYDKLKVVQEEKEKAAASVDKPTSPQSI
jgi:uncharacterized protein (DUF2062 family)